MSPDFEFVYTAKLNEYLVFGLPVVTTATPELAMLSQEFPVKFIYFGMTPQEFAEAGLRALVKGNSGDTILNLLA